VFGLWEAVSDDELIWVQSRDRLFRNDANVRPWGINLAVLVPDGDKYSQEQYCSKEGWYECCDDGGYRRRA
jgi:hypothetical protein